VDGEKVSSTKKSTDEPVKDQGVVGCVFLMERYKKTPLCQEVLARLRDAMRRKRLELWEKQTWMLHHDNAPAHARSSSIVIWQNIRHPLCPIHPIPRT